ncbi:MAG TPA: ribonuclease HIII [Firmicutes bacterium]|nr:ribonuclease HIII [Bacillota bacterium]
MKQHELATILLEKARIEELVAFYEDDTIDVPNEYVAYAANHQGITILVYQKDHHGAQKVVFQGVNALQEATIWGAPIKKEIKTHTPTGWQELAPHIGSDEVGTGDFFGPVIVVAAYFNPKQLDLLSKYKIGDSKKIDDEFIIKIGPQLIKDFPYSLMTVTPEKYNELVASGYNLNRMKAWLHQGVLANLQKKYPSKKIPVYIEKFCTPLQYFKYVKGHASFVNNLHFETKAERQYPAVAIASMIARYAFLTYMAELGAKYGTTFPLGASGKVDAFAASFIAKYKLEELNKLVKQNFKNYNKLI